jgi:hypothetical protein
MPSKWTEAEEVYVFEAIKNENDALDVLAVRSMLRGVVYRPAYALLTGNKARWNLLLQVGRQAA